MKLFLLVVLFIATSSALVTYYRSSDENRVPDSYILVFKPNITDNHVASYIAKLEKTTKVRSTFSIGTFRGVSVTTSVEQLNQFLQHEASLDYIEDNKIVGFGAAEQSCVRQEVLAWNLNRLSSRAIPFDDYYYHGDNAGEGVYSYIIDTGIRITHNEFKDTDGSRAIWGTNTLDSQDSDCNGHGTHVAGTVGGTIYGVAKKVRLVAVKVLNCAGGGTTDSVVNGIDWAVDDCVKNKRTCNANMSLGGGFSKALNDAVKNAVNQGMAFIVAAGNADADACLYSPASEPTAITVGATALVASGPSENEEDQRSSFSNFGSCCDIFAPGSAIPSAWSTSDSAFNTISGTSMAAPHVAGVVSIIQSVSPSSTPAEIADKLRSDSTPGAISLQCENSQACMRSPNNLLFSPFCAP